MARRLGVLPAAALTHLAWALAGWLLAGAVWGAGLAVPWSDPGDDRGPAWDDATPWSGERGDDGWRRAPHPEPRARRDSYAPDSAAVAPQETGRDWDAVGERDRSGWLRSRDAPAEPVYRFRGDPELTGGRAAAPADGMRYRYRPLTENERLRREGASPAERRDSPRPVFGFEPTPWQHR